MCLPPQELFERRVACQSQSQSHRRLSQKWSFHKSAVSRLDTKRFCKYIASSLHDTPRVTPRTGVGIQHDTKNIEKKLLDFLGAVIYYFTVILQRFYKCDPHELLRKFFETGNIQRFHRCSELTIVISVPDRNAKICGTRRSTSRINPGTMQQYRCRFMPSLHLCATHRNKIPSKLTGTYEFFKSRLRRIKLSCSTAC